MSQTNRPGNDVRAGSVLPSIRDVLRFDVVASGLPEVLVGHAELERSVRWVHVMETATAANLLSGGELLLSTGVGWPRDPAEVADFVDQLVDAGIAALVLELGEPHPFAPVALVEHCAVRGLPLIVLHREARFVAITEAVHSRIIADQMGALRARDEIHALFTELSLRGSPADFVVSEVGRTLQAPVVLENLNHQVVASWTNESGDDLLVDWEQRSRAARYDGGVEGDGWMITPVEARGTRWGYLIAVGGDAHPAGRSNVLEQAAIALALGRLADRDSDEWARQSQQGLVEALLAGRFSSAGGLTARFEAAGLPIRGRRLYGLAISRRSIASEATDSRIVAGDASSAARAIGAEAVAGFHSRPATSHLPASPGVAVALSLPPGAPLDDRAATTFASAYAESCGVPSEALEVAIGVEGTDISGLLASIEEALDLGGRAGVAGPAILRLEDRPLLRFVASLGDDPRLEEHSEQMLRPLVEYDLARGGDLLEVLRSYAEHPGNRTRAASASHLSRSVFYQRIAQIEELLDVDLDNGETLSALHTALVARRRSTARPR